MHGTMDTKFTERMLHKPANKNDVSEDTQCTNINHLNIRSEAVNVHVKLRVSTRKSRLSLRTTQRRMEGGEA